MEQIISKEEFDKLMKIKGEAMGIAIRSGFGYTLYRKGEEGLRQLENEMEKLGYPIKYKEIKPMSSYPIGLETIIFLVVKKLFDFNEKDFIELGEREAKLPSIIRLFMKYFGSVGMLAKAAPKMWRKYYTVGDFKVTDFDEEKKYAVIRIKDLNLHPVHCQNLKGYLLGVVKMVGKKNVKCQETKCVYRGDEYHEFLIKWQ